ncbi:MAG: TcaA 3rd/4th domain-containing protein [Lactobacillus sp.]
MQSSNQTVRPRHHSWRWLVLLIIVMASYGYGQFYYQKDRQIARINQVINRPQLDLTPYAVSATTDLAVTRTNLQPLQRYFHNDPRATAAFKANLRRGKNTAAIQIVQSGHYFGIFPRYLLRLQPYHAQVLTNHPRSQLQFNHRSAGELAGADSRYYLDLGLLFPGRYHLAVTSKVASRNLTESAVVNVWRDQTIDLKIKTATFQVQSIPDGRVYFNDKKVKQLDATGSVWFKNYPIAKDTELYVTGRYRGRRIRSRPVVDFNRYIHFDSSSASAAVSGYDDSLTYSGNETRDIYQNDDGSYVVNPIWPGLISEQDAAKTFYLAFKRPELAMFGPDFKPDQLAQIKATIKVARQASHLRRLKIKVVVSQVLPAGRNLSVVNFKLIYTITSKTPDAKATKVKQRYLPTTIRRKSLRIGGYQRVETYVFNQAQVRLVAGQQVITDIGTLKSATYTKKDAN